MFSALHPRIDIEISYSDYIEFSLETGASRPNDALGARCPVCKRRLKVRAGKKKDDGHFYHQDDLFCPTKDPSQRPYLGLVAQNEDLESRKRNKTFVGEHIQQIWIRLKELVPFLDLKEYINILTEAKRLRIYDYTNLDPELIPYVYVTLINFLPRNSYKKKRIYKFCFFYESEIEDYEDLWIDRGEFSRLTRISYSSGTSKTVKVIETSVDYLSNIDKPLSAKQVAWCLKNI